MTRLSFPLLPGDAETAETAETAEELHSAIFCCVSSLEDRFSYFWLNSGTASGP